MAESNLALSGGDNLALALSDYVNDVGNDLADGIGGQPINRISIKGGKFRQIMAGVETQVSREAEMKVLIIRSSPKHQRVFYLKGYDETEGKEKPDCFSHNGDAPSPESPNKQANACSTCPNNEKGSAKNGKGKACAYKKRIIITPADAFKDPTVPPKAYLFDVNGMSMFGDGFPDDNLFSLGAYSNWLKTPRSNWPRGIPPSVIVTRIVMNDEESVPAVTFGPVRYEDGRAAFLSRAEALAALEFSKSEEIDKLMSLNVVEQAVAEGARTETKPATTTQGNKAMAKATKSAGYLHWTTAAAALDVDLEDLKMIKDAGGPSTPRGAKLWDKLVGEPLPEDCDIDGLEPNPPAAAASAGGDWKAVALASPDADPDDVKTIEEAGGPYTERGAKLWGKLFKGVALPAQGGAAAQTWQQVALASPDADPDDVKTIEEAGGPYTERGAKLWGKFFKGVELPAQGGAAVPAAVAKISWQTFAQTLPDVDQDDITTIEEAGGPSTERGAKLWGKFFGVEFPANVDLNPAAPAGKPAVEPPADVKPKRGRAAKNTAPAEPAAEPTATVTPSEKGQAIAAALGAFDG